MLLFGLVANIRNILCFEIHTKEIILSSQHKRHVSSDVTTSETTQRIFGAQLIRRIVCQYFPMSQTIFQYLRELFRSLTYFACSLIIMVPLFLRLLDKNVSLSSLLIPPCK